MFAAESGGEYRIWMEAATTVLKARFKIEKSSGTEEYTFPGTGDPLKFVEREMGVIKLEGAGVQVITIIPEGEEWKELSLKGLRLEKL
jgi:hypothetical protein